MRRVLMLAYYFPPLGGMASQRLRGFARHLAEYGWEAVVVAPRDGAYHRDSELSFPEERVIRTGSIEFSRAGKRLLRTGGDDVRVAEVGRGQALIRQAARSLLYFPDPQIGWYAPALAAARRELRRQPYDAVLSSSLPITAHLIARRLHRSTGLPWIADFRDPWSTLKAPGVLRRRALRLERGLASEASAVTMTSPTWAAEHGRRWGRHVEVIPNGHDDQRASAPRSSQSFVLSYLGTIYPAQQDLSAAWEAIRRGIAAGRPIVDRLRFIGDLHPALAEQIDSFGLRHIVDETGFVSHREAIELLRDSSAALLAGPRQAGGVTRGHVAGKIAEYLASGLPIVYVGDPGSDAAALLRRHAGCHVCAAGDVDGVAGALVACREPAFDRDVSGLSRRSLAKRLAAVLDGAVDSPAGRGSAGGRDRHDGNPPR
ncbi:MAG: glycosyltransferase [Solirubrobacteraceae bacterium]